MPSRWAAATASSSERSPSDARPIRTPKNWLSHGRRAKATGQFNRGCNVGVLSTCIGCGAAAADRWICAACEAEARGPGYLSVSGSEQTDGYDRDLFAVLEDLEPRSFWFRARNDLILWALRRYFPRARD